MVGERYAYLLVEDEKWWNRRCKRNRRGRNVHSFVRRGRVGPIEAQKVLFYVKHPAKQIRGAGDFLERIVGHSDELWSLYGSETVFESSDEYYSFVGGRSNVTFIRLKDLEEFQTPIGLDELLTSTGAKRMPRCGKYLNREAVKSLFKREL